MKKGEITTLKVRVPKRVVFRKGVKRVGDHFPDRYEIDTNIPPRYRKSLLLHEIIEGELQGSGMGYFKAHRIANRIEHKMFPLSSKDWDRYNGLVSEIYYQNRKLKKVM